MKTANEILQEKRQETEDLNEDKLDAVLSHLSMLRGEPHKLEKKWEEARRVIELLPQGLRDVFMSEYNKAVMKNEVFSSLGHLENAALDLISAAGRAPFGHTLPGAHLSGTKGIRSKLPVKRRGR